MLNPVLSIEEKNFLQQFPSQGRVDQQRAISRLFNRQDNLQTRRFLQNLYCKLQLLGAGSELGSDIQDGQSSSLGVSERQA